MGALGLSGSRAFGPTMADEPKWRREAPWAGVCLSEEIDCTFSWRVFVPRFFGSPRRRPTRRAGKARGANGEMHTARFGFLSKTEAAVRRIGPLRRTEALLVRSHH